MISGQTVYEFVLPAMSALILVLATPSSMIPDQARIATPDAEDREANLFRSRRPRTAVLHSRDRHWTPIRFLHTAFRC